MQSPEYKQINGLLQHAQEVGQFNQLFAYLTKAYAAQKLHQLYKKMNPSNEQKEIMNQLQKLMGELEVTKQQMPQVTNKEENKKVYSEFVFKLFFDADTRERDGEVSPELMQMFKATIKFIDVLNYFEPLTPDILEKQKYAKMKLIDQVKKLKNPALIQPKKVDPVDQELEQIAKQQAQIEQPPTQAKSQPTEQLPQPPSQQQTFPSQKNNQPPPQQYNQPPPPVQQFIQPQPPQQYNQPPNQQYHNQPNLQNNQPQYGQPAFVSQTPIQPPIQPLSMPQPVQPSTYQQTINQINQQQRYTKPQENQIPSNNYQNQAQPLNQPTTQVVKLNLTEQAACRDQIKQLLLVSISELDFKKYQQAKIQVQKVLELLNQLMNQ